MHRLAQLSLKNRALIALITIFSAVFGVISMSSLKQELIPSLEFPQIAVIAAQPGASPEVVDEQVARPLETALQAVEGLESSEATSRTNMATISLMFEYGTNMDRARSQVERAISNAKSQLPDDVEPTSFAGSVSDIPVVYLAVSSDQSLEKLHDDVERIALPKLRKVNGVRDTAVSGGASQHIQVLPDDAQMARAGLTAADLKDAIENSGAAIPVGTLDTVGMELPVIAGSAPNTLEKIREIPISTDNGPVLLDQVSEVSIEPEEATSITRTNGEETLSISITKTPDGDTVAISHAVAGMLAQLEAELGSNAQITTVFDQAPFIEQSIDTLTTEGLLGLAFAVLVILVFLFSLRSTLVTAISIPLSLMVSFIGMQTFGYSLNMLTLGALTIAIGRVVDDSIVVIENIKRHLSYGEAKRDAILLAVREVAGAITSATLTTVAVFLPVALVSGMAGELFRPFAMTMTIALLASLLVSLTIVPVLAYWFLPHRPGTGKSTTAHIAEDQGALQRTYAPVLSKTQKHPVITLVVAVLILAGTVAMTPLLNTNLFGGTGENSLRITQDMPSGTSLESTLEQAEKVETLLSDTEGIEDVQLTIGSPGDAMSAMRGASGADSASFTVITDPDLDQQELAERIRGAITELNLPEEQEISVSSGSSSMASSDVAVEISAPDDDILREATGMVREQLGQVPDITGITDNLSAVREQVTVDIDAARAAEAGLTETQLAGIVASQLSPIPAGTLRIDFTDLAINIGKPEALTSQDRLRELQIPTATGFVQLQELADIKIEEVQQVVTTHNGERIATVTLTPQEDQLGAVSASVSERLDSLQLPEGASAALGGAATEQAESFQQLYLALLAAVAIVYVIMVATFKSLIQPLILLVSIPFAATGSIGLLLLTGTPLGLPSLIGMLMLVGIVVTNAIVLIDLINQYRLKTPEREAMSLQDAITHGARQRLRPILMTSAATIFALLPMALGITGHSGFISQPLAVVVIGGLVTSTLLTLVLVPVLYRLVEGRKEKNAHRREAKLAGLNNHQPSKDMWPDSAAARNTGVTTPVSTAVRSSAESKQDESQALANELINPLTGQLPVSRRERHEVEKLMKKEKKEK